MRASIRRALPQVARVVAWVGAAVVATGLHAEAAPKPTSRPSGLSGPSDPAKPARPSRKSSASAAEKEAQAFLTTVTSLLGPVAVSANLADWTSLIDVTPEHTGQRTGADKALAALAGSKLIIEKTKSLLKNRKQLDEETARQLEKLLLSAAESPGTIPDVVAMRVEAEAHQSSILDGFTFCAAPAGKGGACAHPMTANQIDDILRKSRDLPERLRVWTASKEIGRPLKPGLVELIKLRNQVAREMGYHSYFALQVADYGMTVEEMMKLLDEALETTKPLFDGLHCFARYELAARFKRPPPRLIPAHWLGNRWAQSWPGLVESANLDPLFKGATAESIVKSAENFYVSLGFPKLPSEFWERSDLYPIPPGVARKKNAHASAWDINRAGDVRSLMSVEPNAEWFDAAHHELGHIYYFLSYDRPEVPYLLRDGANRAFHEAVGELAKLASQQTPYLVKVGVMPDGKQPDPTEWLLQSALDSIVFLPFSAGTMSHFEHDLYEEELPPTDWQQRWWDDVATFQGVVPPGSREGDLCDACTKSHINDDPAQYYDYALATMIKFQLHDHICSKILKQDVRACDYSGNKEVGAFLKGILSLGATRDWRTVIKEATGEAISPRAMMAFYQPLVDVLAKRNEGRDCSR
jgi:peptidyl-dipeptidase A